MMRFSYSGRSDVGRVRDHNEDAGFASPYLQLVADGVGGSAAGEVASATAAYVTSALAMQETDEDPCRVLRRAVTLTHEQLAAGVRRDPDREGMSTTLTAVLTDGNRFALAHLGDSRAYLLRDGHLEQVTRDHTWVQALLDEGRLTREEVRQHPYRNVVTKALDGQSSPEPDVQEVDLRPGDRLLVCSDGLSDLVPAADLARLIGHGDPESATGRLLTAALDGGGTDNVTCLVADVVEGPPLSRDGTLLGALGDPRLVVDAAGVRREPRP